MENYIDKYYELILKNKENIIKVPDNLLAYKPFAIKICDYELELFKYISQDLRDNVSMIDKYVFRNSSLMRCLSKDVLDNEYIWLMHVEKKPWILEHLSPRLKNKFDFVKKIVNMSGLTLRYASEELRDNEEICFTAILNNRFASEYISSRLKNDIPFMKMVLKKTLIPSANIGLNVLDDECIVNNIVDNHLHTPISIGSDYAYLRDISHRLKENYELVKKYVSFYPYNYLFIPEHFKREEELLAIVFEKNKVFITDIVIENMHSDILFKYDRYNNIQNVDLFENDRYNNMINVIINVVKINKLTNKISNNFCDIFIKFSN